MTASGDGEPVALPVALSPPLSIGLGYLRWGTVAAANLISCAAGPHLAFMGLRDGVPPAFHGLGAPDQGASQGPFGPLGPNGGDQY